MARPLSEKQLEFFHEEGYLVVPQVFSDEVLKAVEDEISAEIHARAVDAVERGVLSQTYSELPFETQLAAISKETDEVARSIWNGVLAGPAFFNLIRDPALLDVAEQMCGPEIIASSVYRLRPKIPNYNYGAVPWHQDSGYFEPYCDKALVLTVWLPLVDATPENGCLWVLPKVHREGTIYRHTIRDDKPYLIIPDEELPTGHEPVCAPVPRGGVLLMTNRTPHVSYENSTGIVRWSMDLRYQSASLPTNAPITRLAEEIEANAGADVPIACYPPEADFLVRSTTRPQEVVTDPAVFHALRTNHKAGALTDRWTLSKTAW